MYTTTNWLSRHRHLYHVDTESVPLPLVCSTTTTEGILSTRSRIYGVKYQLSSHER